MSYSSGNAPEDDDVMAALKEATDRGVLIVNVTQCPTGAEHSTHTLAHNVDGRRGVCWSLQSWICSGKDAQSNLLRANERVLNGQVEAGVLSGSAAVFRCKCKY